MAASDYALELHAVVIEGKEFVILEISVERQDHFVGCIQSHPWKIVYSNSIGSWVDKEEGVIDDIKIEKIINGNFPYLLNASRDVEGEEPLVSCHAVEGLLACHLNLDEPLIIADIPVDSRRSMTNGIIPAVEIKNSHYLNSCL